MARQFGVSVLAKIWFRSKHLRRLKGKLMFMFLRIDCIRAHYYSEWYLQRSALNFSKKYESLGNRKIRLLQICPGHDLNTIECDFLYVDLHSPGEYTALSYAWKKQDACVPILLNGMVHLVTEDVYMALLYLRKRQVTILWIDTLCINQEDTEERNRQVQQMKDIYQRASLVVIWLGESNDSSTLAFNALHGMLEHLDWQDRVPSDIFRRENSMEWRAISDLLYRPWFRRTWIIQEVLAARCGLIVCGEDVLYMETFLKIINSMLFDGSLLSIMSHHVNRHELARGPMKIAKKQLEFLVNAKFGEVNLLSPGKFKPTLLNYLAETRWAEASLPVDKVYGILNLAEDAGSLGFLTSKSEWTPFRVDYNLSKEQVFIRATKAILCTTRSLEVLRFAVKQTDHADGLPSWVPDWANNEPPDVPDYMPVVSVNTTGQELWRVDPEPLNIANRWSPVREAITQYCWPSFKLGSNNTLIMRGIHFDTITVVSIATWPCKKDLYGIDPNSRNHGTQDEILETIEHQLEVLHDWIDDCTQRARKCSPYPTGESTSDALWRTLNGNFAKGKLLEPPPCDGHLGIIQDARSTIAFVKSRYPMMRSDATDPLLEIALEAAMSHLENLFPSCGIWHRLAHPKDLPLLGRIT
jgi:Heterokaryon incompatibility protein (HET)